jgi:hypothetical protein
LKPTTPLKEAGARIEPPMSEPLASAGPAGRAADAELRVPRVARHAVQPRVGEQRARELGRGGTGVDDRAGVEHPLREHR